METKSQYKKFPIGRAVEKVRVLKGNTQQEIADALGISKQAYSKIEQSESIEPERLGQIAKLFGVTVDGLKNFTEESIFVCTQNIHDTATFTNSQVAAYQSGFTINNAPKEMFDYFEKIIQLEREQLEILKNKLNL
jgi:transcriptional regulator with XRE-family HTH domain